MFPCVPTNPMIYAETNHSIFFCYQTGVKAKVENKDQYQQYLESLDGLRQELGVALREELYPQEE